jgi:SAM-dependent methyltransferase
MPDFDAIADRYDQFRSLPEGVAASVREAVRRTVGTAAVPVLEVGAGTGRIGEAFVAAGDGYIGSDPSRPMLEHFAAKLTGRGSHSPCLVQADGRALPFSDDSFGVVLLVSVLSGLRPWRWLLDESRRVLRPGGALVLGQTVRPPDGVDAKMKARLALILEELGVDARPLGASRDEARDLLTSESGRHAQVCAARWVLPRSPRDFLTRHRTGARFAALPEATQDEALLRLADWAGDAFGSLDTASDEMHSFLIDVFTF